MLCTQIVALTGCKVQAIQNIRMPGVRVPRCSTECRPVANDEVCRYALIPHYVWQERCSSMKRFRSNTVQSTAAVHGASGGVVPQSESCVAGCSYTATSSTRATGTHLHHINLPVNNIIPSTFIAAIPSEACTMRSVAQCALATLPTVRC